MAQEKTQMQIVQSNTFYDKNMGQANDRSMAGRGQ
jgi:hypothetical protein